MSTVEISELRETLARAQAAADLLGDDTRVGEVGRYLGSATLLNAIDRISDHRGAITLVVGAGASMEAGLPSWPTLVGRMLERLASERLPDPALYEPWIEATQSESLTAAAAVVEALSVNQTDFVDRVREALYDGLPSTHYQPQALAQQVAWFKRQLGDSVRIVTGNYDGLLETALEAEGLHVHSYIQARAEPPGSAAVYHLHGRLIPHRRPGRIVLADADYARIQGDRSWQDAFMRDRLNQSLCVFVGASLTDPNLIRWLYRYAGGADQPPHLAVFARQSATGLLPDVRPLVEEAAAARWAQCGVEAVFADFFGEIGQFLHEVAVRRRRGGRVTPFHQRARDRYERGRNLLVPADAGLFGTAQDRACEFLQTLLVGVRTIAAAGEIDLTEERLGLALWGIDHDAGTAAVWATSDRRMSEPEAVMPNPLELQSRWVAVEAATRGVVVERDPRVYASRWRLIRGIPIVVESPTGAGRTVSGVFTLTSMTPQAESQISASAEVSSAIDRHLANAGRLVFI